MLHGDRRQCAGNAPARIPSDVSGFDVLLSRRSVGRLLSDRPPRELIECLLVAACNGALWRTGDTAYDPAVKAALGRTPEHDAIGFIYVGFPDPAQPPPPPAPRHPPAEVTRWWGW